MAKHSTNRSKKKEKKKSQQEINLENLQAGFHLIQYHGLFGYCNYYRQVLDGRNMGKHTYATITSDGILHVNETLELSLEQWAYVIAHHLVHLAFGHFDAEKMPVYYITDQTGKQVWKTDFIPGSSITLPRDLTTYFLNRPKRKTPIQHHAPGIC